MKTSEKYYRDFHGYRVVPETRLEEEVLRQAILGEKWDLHSSERAALPLSFHSSLLLVSSGGVATYQPHWSPDFVVHYQIDRHRDDGFFDMTMKLLSVETSEPTGCVNLLAALQLQSLPLFQTRWKGAEREHHFIPFWYFIPGKSDPRGVSLKIQRKFCEPLFVPGERGGGDCHFSPPHFTLVDICDGQKSKGAK